VSAVGAIPIGINADHEFSAETLKLIAGERLVLYSDGIIEQRNAAGQQLGFAALKSALAASGTSADDVRAAFAAVDAHGGGGALDDDATVVSVELAS
jgi:serine phosphatase RsbU (regulator of sigma subunit)